MISKEMRVDTIQAHSVSANFHGCESISLHSDQNSEKCLLNIYRNKWNDFGNLSQCSSYQYDRCGSSYTGDEGNSGASNYRALSPLHGVHLDFSQFGWCHWFTKRDLELATSGFSNENLIGEGGYGIVYKGQLINGTEVAIKRLLNNTGQAEKEFKVEVEDMSHLLHKNLFRLLGYCIEGIHRMLVYEYVNNGNLEQWLHGSICQRGQCYTLSWDARMKVILGTAKGLAYLHEAIEPKVVHRDIKASNILVDKDLNAKVSDFGLAKLLGSDRNHIATRVMGTFGYVAPEYANTGLLNEKSDVYSFGVLLIESITGRDPVDYTRPANEVNLVEWLKMMIGNRRMDEVLDPSLENKPTSRALKRALIVAIKCVDLVSEERPKMGQVVQMLENAEISFREGVRRNRHNVHMSDNIDFSRNNSCLNPVANSASHNGKQNEIAVSS